MNLNVPFVPLLEGKLKTMFVSLIPDISLCTKNTPDKTGKRRLGVKLSAGQYNVHYVDATPPPLSLLNQSCYNIIPTTFRHLLQ